MRKKHFCKKIYHLFFQRSALLLIGVCLSACSPILPPPQQSELNQQHWILRGRVAVSHQNKAESASVYWQQQGTHYLLRLFGPLGIGAVELQGQPGQVLLHANNGRLYQAKSPEALMQQTIGWPLPVSHLVYWVRGLPAPHVAAVIQRDRLGRLQFLSQQGWQIHYLSYMTPQSNTLPRLLVCTRPDWQIRLAIDQWALTSSEKK